MAGEINKMQPRQKDTTNWITPAIGALGGIASGIIGQGAQKRAEKRQLENSKKMAEFNQKQALEMWEKTNYPAQIAQMKKAGLNVGLMYEGGGTAGQAQANSQTMGMQNDQTGQRISEGMGMALNARMQEAQIKLAEATANKTEVEADKLAGTDTEESKARTASLLQGIENAKSQKELTDIQTKIATIENIEQWMTQEDRVDRIKSEARKIEQEARSALAQANIDEATQQQKIDIIGEELTYSILKNALTGATITKTNEETRKIGQEIFNLIAEEWATKKHATVASEKVWNEGKRLTEEERKNRMQEILTQAGIDQQNKDMWMGLFKTVIGGVVSRGNTIISNRK